MTARAIAIRTLVTVALIGAPILALASFAERGSPDADALQLAQGGGPGMTGSTGGGNSNAGTALGPEADRAGDAGDAARPPPEGRMGTSQGDTEGHGRESHGGSSGAMRPEPTRVP